MVLLYYSFVIFFHICFRIKDTIANLSEQVKVLEETIARLMPILYNNVWEEILFFSNRLKQSAKEKLKEKNKKGVCWFHDQASVTFCVK